MDVIDLAKIERSASGERLFVQAFQVLLCGERGERVVEGDSHKFLPHERRVTRSLQIRRTQLASPRINFLEQFAMDLLKMGAVE